MNVNKKCGNCHVDSFNYEGTVTFKGRGDNYLQKRILFLLAGKFILIHFRETLEKLYNLDFNMYYNFNKLRHEKSMERWPPEPKVGGSSPCWRTSSNLLKNNTINGHLVKNHKCCKWSNYDKLRQK